MSPMALVWLLLLFLLLGPLGIVVWIVLFLMGVMR